LVGDGNNTRVECKCASVELLFMLKLKNMDVLICPKTQRPCEISGCGGTLCAVPKYPSIPLKITPQPLTGWICPRCAKVHSPFSLTCDCPAQTVSSVTVKK